ncbi:MAG: 3-keto-5-aminohexanoate cleavage protein [Actinomycetota bacterium]|nr:3-keto-5-aminohexanoate cleavage protein [Actinomycetota bacterium]
MSLEDKCIITAALAGAATMKNQNPAVPYTVDEFIEEAYRCYNAGCAIVHIHARDPETGLPSSSIETLTEIVKGIKDKCAIVINLSTAIGIGATPEERINVVKQIKPEMASLNTNSMNFALGDWKNHVILGETVFTNTFDMLVSFAKEMKEAGTKPELEVYDLGGIYNTLFVRHQEIFVEPLHYQFVWGVLGGCGLDLGNFQRFRDLIPDSATWSTCGVGPAQFRGAFISAAEGGHIRVGLEDNITVRKGVLAKGSYEQVEKAVKIAELADREAATPDETRQILSLKSGPDV